MVSGVDERLWWLTSRAATIAICASLALHLVFLLGLPSLHWLRLSAPTPIEVLPMQKRAAAPPMVDPGDPAARPKRAPGAGPKPPAPPRPPAPPPAEDLRNIGPSTANVTIILRCPLLARSPHRAGVDTLLSALPDYHTLLDGTGLSPFDDLDALLIATPDPRDVTVTFLAARHHGDARVRALATRALAPGDPRQFRALGDDLMLLGQPQDLQRIAAAEAGAEAQTAEAQEGARWLAALRRFDAGASDAALQLTIADLPQLIRLRDRTLPLPRTVRIAASAEASPAARVVLVFDTEPLAATFAEAWPRLREQLGDAAPMFGGALDAMKLERKDRVVELAGRLPELQVRMALALVQMLIPHAPRPATPLPEPQAPDPQGPQ